MLLLNAITGPYEIIVHKVREDVITLVVISTGSMAGSGNIVETFNDEVLAKKTGEIFIRNLRIAVDMEYHLSDRYFTHAAGKRVHISNAMDTNRSKESFKQLLETGEF